MCENKKPNGNDDEKVRSDDEIVKFFQSMQAKKQKEEEVEKE